MASAISLVGHSSWRRHTALALCCCRCCSAFPRTPHTAAMQEVEAVHSLATPMAALIATVVHTMGYLAVTGLVALVVYRKLGLALLRKAWINLHLIWAVALIVSAAFTLLI